MSPLPGDETARSARPGRRAAARAPGLDEGALGGVLGYHISQASVTTLELFGRHVGEPLDLRPVEFSLLLLLQANTQVTPKLLAQALALSAPNLTILLDRLQERGLIERVRSEADRRSQHVLLTPTGLQLAERCVALCGTMELELDDCLTPGEHLLLIELLQKVVRHGRRS
ncbi:MAG: MarR family winged helix-turn-helix transcriptional regulator [Burkholderiaceae bacterium]|nr:MarR family winged helix-turn-helix transcriptional regulator [Burkholderiaceae bacterium]